MPEDNVENTEVLYRRIPQDAKYASKDPDGNLRLSYQAFWDRNKRPSVDRAHLNDFDLERTKKEQTDGVVSLTAGAARSVHQPKLDAKQRPTGETYLVDVEAVPLPDNLAHAEIFGRPPFDTDSLFKRIFKAIAELCRWECEPGELP